MRVCPSVSLSVGWPSVRPSVRLHENRDGGPKLTLSNVFNVLAVLNVLNVLHVLNMPKDASLACWPLFSQIC